MAKTLYFTAGVASMHRGDNSAKLTGATTWWQPLLLSEARGFNASGGVAYSIATVTGPTAGLEVLNTSATVPAEWISEPLSADFTIAGTITANLWGLETAMTDNAAINFVVDKIDGATGAITQIVKSARVVELGTSAAAANFTATPTSTACKRGDRIRARVFVDDVGTLAAPGPARFYADQSAVGSQGDSWIQFTENLTFELDPGLIALEQSNRDSSVTLGGSTSNERHAQPFVATKATLTEVRAWLAKIGSPTDNVVVEIQSDSSGVPSGTVIDTVATVTGASITGTATQFTWATSISLTQGNTYWLVFRRSGAVSGTAFYDLTYGFTPSGWTGSKSYDSSIPAWSATASFAFSVKLVFSFTPSTYYLTNGQSGLTTVPTLVSSFTGTDENPLSEGGNWALLNTSGFVALKRLSNQIAAGTGSSMSYWTPANFGPDLEAYVTFAIATSMLGSGIVVRVQGEGGAGTWDGYSVTCSSPTQIQIRRHTNAAATLTISITTPTWGNGDKLGVRCEGNTIQAWRLPNGSSTWNFLGAMYDTVYPSAGKIGLWCEGTTVRVDDFYAATDSNLFAQKASTTRGSSSVNAIVSTATGPVTPHLVGEWYTPPLEAFTLGGKAKFNIRALESNLSANASLKAEVAIVNNDGTTPVVWGMANIEALTTNIGVGELGTSDAAWEAWVAGDDTAIADGQRLRFRIFVDDCGDFPLVTGFTTTVSYNGTTAAAAGDTYVILPAVVTEIAAVEYTDSATASLVFAPSAIEGGPYSDSATKTLVFIPSSGETAQFIDTTVEVESFDQSLTTASVSLAASTVKRGQKVVLGGGRLNHIKLKLDQSTSPTGDLIVELRSGSSVATSTLVATKTVLNASVPTSVGIVQVNFNGESISAGDHWIVIYRTATGGGNFNIYYTATDRYAPGEVWLFSSGSWAFSTAGDIYFLTSVILTAGVVSLTLTPSSSEIYTPGAGGTIYTDSETAFLDLQPLPDVDVAEFLEATTALVKLIPSGSDIEQVVDASTAKITLNPSSVDIEQAVDSVSVGLNLTPSGVDVSQLVDSNTAKVLLSPSGSDIGAFVDSGVLSINLSPITTQEGVEHTDINTASVLLTPSGTEFQGKETTDSNPSVVILTPSGADISAYIEIGTISLKMTPSTSETAQFVDVNTAFVSFIPSSSETAAYIDSAIASVSLVPSGTDVIEHVTLDSGTVSLALNVSAGEIAQYTEINTVILRVFPSSVDIAQLVESGLVGLKLTPSGTDEYSQIGAIEYTDANTAIMLFTPSTVELREQYDATTVPIQLNPSASDIGLYTDLSTVGVSLIPSGTDLYAAVEANTIRLAILPSSVEQFAAVETGIVAINLFPSSTESLQAVDSTTAVVAFAPSSTDIAQSVDTSTGIIALTPSGTETLSGQSIDAGTVNLAMQASAVETRETIDAGTSNLIFTVSSVETQIWLDAAIVQLTFGVSGAETGAYIDAGVTRLALQPSGVEQTTFSDITTAQLRMIPSTIEQRISDDFNTINLLLNPSRTETTQTVDSSMLYLDLLPSGIEQLVHGDEDIGTVYLRFTPMLLFKTTGVLYGRWSVRLLGVIEQAQYVKQRFKARMKPRWSNSSLFRG